jgi:hypothetical protein
MSDKKHFRAPPYVNDGMKVIAPYNNKGKRTGLLCVVACAAGNHARVVNEMRGFDEWFHIDDLRVEEKANADTQVPTLPSE